jgi:hypothetical protein
MLNRLCDLFVDINGEQHCLVRVGLGLLDLGQPDLHFLLLIGQNGKRIAVGYANNCADKWFSLSRRKTETA